MFIARSEKRLTDKIDINRISLVLFLVLFLSGCVLSPAETVINKPPSASEVPSDTSVGADSIPKPDGESIVYGEANKFLTRFPFPWDFTIYNDWIYYSHPDADGFRKCKADLTQDVSVPFSSFSIINQDGYSIESIEVNRGRGERGRPGYEPNIMQFNINNYNDGSSETLDLPSKDVSFANLILYKNKIFLRDFYNNRIDMYDRQGDFVKTIYPERAAKFSIIDDALYFLSSSDDTDDIENGNAIIRYNIENETIEKIFDFVIGKSYSPIVYYNNRNIIVQNGRTSFIYTCIDNNEPKEIALEFSKGQWHSVVYIPSDDGDLYFQIRNYKDDSAISYGYTPPTSIPTEFYKVVQGTTQPLLLKELHYHGDPMFFSGEYLYFFDYESMKLEMKGFEKSVMPD